MQVGEGVEGDRATPRCAKNDGRMTAELAGPVSTSPLPEVLTDAKLSKMLRCSPEEDKSIVLSSDTQGKTTRCSEKLTHISTINI